MGLAERPLGGKGVWMVDGSKPGYRSRDSWKRGRRSSSGSSIEVGERRAFVIQGKRGTGRRYMAQTIHTRSAGRDAPFLVHDCRRTGSLPLRRTFLGEVRELAPGHYLRYLGLLEEVGDGTLYLDGVTRLPREIQESISHVLENGSFSPIGSADVRTFRGYLVFSTSQDLESAARAGSLDPGLCRVLKGSVQFKTSEPTAP